MSHSHVDFGYPWWLSYGHLVILVPALALLGLGRWLGWRKWLMIAFGAVALWAATAMVMMRSFNVNGLAELPTESFLRSGEGRVLDIGAGTGRSAIMVLEARPRATLVALDQFGHSFEQHFGPSPDPQKRLRDNLAAVGLDQRASIVSADMRKLPFEPASFDAIVSAYAVDHLGRDGAAQALGEAARVVKPGGEFLLILVHNDGWTRFAFGPLLSHGGLRGAGWWRGELEKAGFQVAEEGTRPATLFFLARRVA
ncbi:MAG: class I SAM-dependent methyltransferase [Bryobacteraceae bacterium]